MKINSTLINKTYGSQISNVDHKKSNTAKSITEALVSNTDKVVMSQQAMTAQTVAKASRAIVEELNEDYGSHHIAMLKEAIKNGTYQIDSEKIAQAMMNQARVLGGKDE